ncbi:uncharacterized protein BCR38DRAFT_404156 [Pseudomassariella vexata]|uniref:Uncharacterized protein n=1 Tax=Pseudomassariella vexata TaxID=1141098 RepID=A0A1Y2EHI7_9PEZI|nr:uncharacterized protein BCR38DRAFT_404156 [Pseudomassariella vexata]ORY71031.1 hypothetical protein BCR38DRAFT_404156 [Pseudomassariella vexata]
MHGFTRTSQHQADAAIQNSQNAVRYSAFSIMSRHELLDPDRSATAQDVTNSLSESAKHVYLSHRNGFILLSRLIPADEAFGAKLKVHLFMFRSWTEGNIPSVSAWPFEKVAPSMSAKALTDIPDILDLFPELREGNKKWFAPGCSMKDIYGMAPALRWNWDVSARYAEVEDVGLEAKYRDAMVLHGSSSGVPIDTLNQLATKLDRGDLLPTHGSDGGAWVLRNLDAREVVQFKAIKDEEGCMRVYVEDHSWLTIDYVIMMRILWQGGFHEDWHTTKVAWSKEGTWAGHRFDIVEAGGLVTESSWRDVTEDLTKEAEELRTWILAES